MENYINKSLNELNIIRLSITKNIDKTNARLSKVSSILSQLLELITADNLSGADILRITSNLTKAYNKRRELKSIRAKFENDLKVLEFVAEAIRVRNREDKVNANAKYTPRIFKEKEATKIISREELNTLIHGWY